MTIINFILSYFVINSYQNKNHRDHGKQISENINQVNHIHSVSVSGSTDDASLCSLDDIESGWEYIFRCCTSSTFRHSLPHLQGIWWSACLCTEGWEYFEQCRSSPISRHFVPHLQRIRSSSSQLPPDSTKTVSYTHLTLPTKRIV